jgi:hypothetical protein
MLSRRKINEFIWTSSVGNTQYFDRCKTAFEFTRCPSVQGNRLLNLSLSGGGKVRERRAVNKQRFTLIFRGYHILLTVGSQMPVELSALRTDLLLTSRKIPGTHFS